MMNRYCGKRINRIALAIGASSVIHSGFGGFMLFGWRKRAGSTPRHPQPSDLLRRAIAAHAAASPTKPSEDGMSERALKFVERWVQDHIGSDAFVNRDGDERPGQLAAACLDAAAKHGIAVAEIDEEFDSLEGYIAEAIDRFAQAEFSRLRTQEPS